MNIKIILENPEGYDSGRVEELQRRWFEETEVVKDIREFQTHLSKAFEEFNLQLTLGGMRSSLNLFIPKELGEAHQIQKRIINAFGGIYDPSRGNLFSALDNAYYDTAIRSFHQMGKPWQKLRKTIFGRIFTLSEEEDRECMEKMISQR